jgi:hypothetical protein
MYYKLVAICVAIVLRMLLNIILSRIKKLLHLRGYEKYVTTGLGKRGRMICLSKYIQNVLYLMKPIL